jgi:hypothetical protein
MMISILVDIGICILGPGTFVALKLQPVPLPLGVHNADAVNTAANLYIGTMYTETSVAISDHAAPSDGCVY